VRDTETWATRQENPVNQKSQETHGEPEMEEQLSQEYCVFFDKSCKVECPVPDCPGRYSEGRTMRLLFRDRYLDDKIVVEQEGCFPRCVRCNMVARTVGTTHQATKMCKEATSRREKQTRRGHTTCRDEGKRRVHSQW
jgi:hypothetical protein